MKENEGDGEAFRKERLRIDAAWRVRDEVPELRFVPSAVCRSRRSAGSRARGWGNIPPAFGTHAAGQL